jgi:hypothetical protein
MEEDNDIRKNLIKHSLLYRRKAVLQRKAWSPNKDV